MRGAWALTQAASRLFDFDSCLAFACDSRLLHLAACRSLAVLEGHHLLGG